MFKVGILGVGNMGEAILNGIINSSILKPSEILIYDNNRERVETLVEKYDVAAASDVKNLVNLSEIVFLAVKPKDFKSSIESTVEFFKEDKVVVSVMAGVKIEEIMDVIKRGYVVRTMPNTPALIGEGVIGVSFGFEKEEIEFRVLKMLSSLGLVVKVEESFLDVITGLSGSGPAYVFSFIDALAQGGVKMGLPYSQALEIAIQTVIGSAKLLRESKEHPAILRDRVTSPAGTTIYGIHELEKRNFRDAIISAVERATLRSRELSDKS
ncbi:MAG: pyrroline-5-carboxylate reductase [Hydrogenothermaceae bacterium]|nr:pyrroline-5-carboxylate reductase [Hydrogenothermaceae bacterium]